MARIARLVIPGAAHHVTQRGNNRKQIRFSGQDDLLYLQFFEDRAAGYHRFLMGYCLCRTQPLRTRASRLRGGGEGEPKARQGRWRRVVLAVLSCCGAAELNT